jgi:hypothetical protein
MTSYLDPRDAFLRQWRGDETAPAPTLAPKPQPSELEVPPPAKVGRPKSHHGESLFQPDSTGRLKWPERLTAAYQQAVADMAETTFRLAKLVTEARRAMPFRQFLAMQTPLTPWNVRRLTAIARDKRLPPIAARLPTNWHLLYLLSRLDDETFQRFLDDGTIRHDMRKSPIAKLLRAKRAERKQNNPSRPIVEVPAEMDLPLKPPAVNPIHETEGGEQC